MAENRDIYLIGMGPGSASLLTAEARDCLLSLDAVAGAERTMTLYREIGGSVAAERCLVSFRTAELLQFLEALPDDCRRVGFLFTGALSVYSGATALASALAESGIPRERMHFLSGLSSLDYFLDHLGERRESVAVLSLHGREGSVLPLLAKEEKLLVLLGGRGQLGAIAQELLNFGLSETEMVLGSRLSYPEEMIRRGKPTDFLDTEADSLSLLYLRFRKDTGAAKLQPSDFYRFGIEDARFFRVKGVPMTKQAARSFTLSQLPLQEDALIYDIGAGSGSVSVELCLHVPRGRVLAFESDAAALSVLQENKKRFLCGNLRIVPGFAPDTLPSADTLNGRPDLVFIGGSRRRLSSIIEAVLAQSPDCTIAVHAITMETEQEILTIAADLTETHRLEMLTMAATELRPMGKYHMRSAQNPITLAMLTPRASFDESLCLDFL